MRTLEEADDAFVALTEAAVEVDASSQGPTMSALSVLFALLPEPVKAHCHAKETQRRDALRNLSQSATGAPK